mgnify:CR=1 FL=1
MATSVCLLTAPGTNCEAELAHAFALAGADARLVSIQQARADPGRLDADILALPGGFSYGDDIASGRIFAFQLVQWLGERVCAHVERGGLVLGVCNGFQVLVKSGLLPGGVQSLGRQEASLVHNDCGQFRCQWIDLAAGSPNRCVWTQGLPGGPLPMAHGEGRFVAAPERVDALRQAGQVALVYADAAGRMAEPGTAGNPNGSIGGIAGMCDPTGRVLGLMPHPERFTDVRHHPSDWPAEREPFGLELIRTGVRAAGI